MGGCVSKCILGEDSPLGGDSGERSGIPSFSSRSKTYAPSGAARGGRHVDTVQERVVICFANGALERNATFARPKQNATCEVKRRFDINKCPPLAKPKTYEELKEWVIKYVGQEKWDILEEISSKYERLGRSSHLWDKFRERQGERRAGKNAKKKEKREAGKIAEKELKDGSNLYSNLAKLCFKVDIRTWEDMEQQTEAILQRTVVNYDSLKSFISS